LPVVVQIALIVIEVVVGVQLNDNLSWSRSPIHALSNLSGPIVPGTVTPSLV